MELTTETLRLIEDVTPGNAAIYRIDGGRIETIYTAPTLPLLNGMTRAEYEEVTGGDASAIVLPDDLPGLMEAVRNCIASHQPLDCYYRVYHRKNGFDWVHATAKYIGENEGRPVLLALYTNASVETDIYQNLLDQSSSMVYVCDRTTRKILYANKAALELHKGGGQLADSTCFAYMQGRSRQCEDCVIDRRCDGPLHDKRRDPKSGRWSLITGEFVNWCGHDAFVHYIRDITESESKRQEMETILEAERNLVRAVQILCGPGSLGERQNDLLAFLGECFQADRAYICEIDEGGATVSNTFEWCRQGVTPEIDGLQCVDIHKMDYWLPDFMAHRPVTVPDLELIRETQPDVYELMARQNIHSYIEAPIIANDKLSGFIGVDNPLAGKAIHAGDMLLSLAYAVSNAQERDRGERLLTEAGSRYRQAVEGADLGVWEYRIREHVLANPSSRLRRYGVPQTVANFPSVLLPKVAHSDRKKLLEMYSRIEAGAPSVTADIWMQWTPNSEPVCERVVYSVVKDQQGVPVTAYGVSIDVTAQKLEQTKFQRSMQALLTANPEALGAFQLNLTKNSCGEGRSTMAAGVTALPSDTVDEFFANMMAIIPSADDRRAFCKVFTREKLLKAFAEDKSSLQLEFRRRGKGGRTFWGRTYISMLRNPDTQDVEAVIYSIDVSRARREQEIFRIITDQEYDFVALLHADKGKIEFVHLSAKTPAKYREFFRTQGELYDFAEIRSLATSTWIDADDREKYLRNGSIESIRRELDNNGRYEFTLQEHFEDAPENTMCRKFQHYYLDEDRDTILIIESDVTETYRQQQKELERSRAEKSRVQDILDSVTSGVCVLRMTDQDHLSIEYVNLQLFRMLGLKPLGNTIEQIGQGQDSLVSAYFQDAFSGVHPDDLERVKKTFRENFRSERFTIGNYRVVGANGRYFWIREDVALREVTPEGRVFYAAYYDVSGEVRLQQELSDRLAEEEKLRRQATAANDAKTEFLSRMSHDIRTPLNGIMGMTHIAREQQNPSRTKDCLNKIDISSKFLLGLVSDILDMTKAESGKIVLHPEPYPFREFRGYIDSVIKPLCSEKNQRLSFDTGQLWDDTLMMDVLRVNQIYFNLLSNAVKYTPEGGEISLRIRTEDMGGGRVRVRSEVRDNGIGISEGFQKVLFEPFTQENRSDISEMRGSGLGLAIVKKIVDAMGGTISVSSSPGHGTAFTFTIDYGSVSDRQPRQKSDSGVEPADDSVLAGRHVLLCEDHPMNQEIAKAVLEEKQMLPEIAENGQLGAEMFARSPEGFYAVVLMDIRMPVMDGYEAAKAIRALPRGDARTVPIIAMTADAFSEDVHKCLAAGMNGHVAKPIDPQLLYASLSEAIARRGRSPS